MQNARADYVGKEACPWCGSPITHAKFTEIESKIREQLQRKVAEVEESTRKRLEAKFSQDLEGQKRTLAKQAKDEVEKRVATLAAEKSQALIKVTQLQAQQATLQKQAQEEAQKRKQLEKQFQQEVETAKQGAEKTAKEEAERQLQRELNQQRLILEKAKDQDVLKKQAEFNREREALQKKMLEMERQLQRKTANEIGDGAEIDVYEVLRETFPRDHITRVPKGQPGADIHHEVMYKGESCGRIIIDSKNRQAWQNSYITKLRQDQTEAKAEHAILATTVFPSGKKELCVECDVVVVNPGRLIYIVDLLRRAMVMMHIRGLSMKERTGKMSHLYKFITSEVYAQRFGEATKLTSDILELDVQEKTTHDNVWKKRGTLATRLQNVLREVDTEISAIVESEVGSEIPAA
jgi:hypothetical protein